MGNININYTPLTSGMVRNVPEDEVPIGGFLTANGVIIENGKMYLRPRWKQFNNYTAYNETTYGRAVNLIQHMDSSGDLDLFLLTEKAILHDTGTAWSAESIERDSVATTTPLSYDTRTSIQFTTGRDDNGDAIWVSDGSNHLLKYAYSDDSWEEVLTSMDSPRTVCYHDSRLWIGGPSSSQGTMLKWSDLNAPDTVNDASYIYFPERSLPLTKIIPMGQFLVLYFPDAVYVGQATGNPLLPYSFFDSQMSMVGLKGPHAISSWRNGHVFVSSKGIFWLRPDRVIEPIPCPIFSFLMEEPTELERFYIINTPDSEDLYFVVPLNDECGRIVHFNYTSSSWTYWENNFDCMYVRQSISTINIGEYNADGDVGVDDYVMTLPSGYEFTNNYSEAEFESQGIYGWDDFFTFVSEISPTIVVDGQEYVLSSSASYDSFLPAVAPIVELVTGDITFDEIDMNKTFHKLKIRTSLTGTHDWSLYGSRDGGDTWSLLGTWTQDSSDERWVNFRFTGAECRFKLLADAPVPPYQIRDISMRVRGRGLEVT